MKFTAEMLEKAKNAKSAEELLEMAKAENVEMTADEAAKFFADLHKSGELSDEELENAAGGGCFTYTDLSPKGKASSPAEVQYLYWVGKYVEVYRSAFTPSTEGKRTNSWTRAADITDRKIERYDKYYYPKYQVKYRDDQSEAWIWQNQIQY